MYQHTAKDIIRLLTQDVERVARYLLPYGKKQGNEWSVGSVDGESGESLKVCLSGHKAGIWSDFAEGIGGDLLNLWCATRKLGTRDAIIEIKGWLGIAPTKFEPQRRLNYSRPEPQDHSMLSTGSPITVYLTEERKLTFETLLKFQIKEKYNEIVFPFYRNNELIMEKYLRLDRPNGKKLIRVSSNAEPCLFGWQAVPNDARSLVIVEGEIDAMSLYQYGLKGLAVLSVPYGGGGGDKQRWIENEFDNLSFFDEIFLCLDPDSPGQIATQEIIQRLGRYRCRIVKLPCKDPNECLTSGISAAEMQKCFSGAITLDPEELKRASTYVDQVIQELYPTDDKSIGYELPWDKIGGNICFRPDELSIWTGINGHGKSQFLGQILLHSMKQGAKVCIASLELKPKRLLSRLTRQASGLRNPSIEYIREIHRWYEEHLWIFDLVGSAKTSRLIEVFKYAKQRYGVDVFVVDSFMKCGIAEDDYNAQKQFIEQLCDFKNEYNCHIHLVVHPRKGADEMKFPGKLDMKGSGAISDLADNCFSIWRNKLKEEEVKRYNGSTAPHEILEKFDCIFSCDKQRNGEWEGKIGLWFDTNSFQYLSGYKKRPIQMIEYSAHDSN